MAFDIEPLLGKITELAPRFGRAREDLEALASRGRANDYKGVMQNARLVLEALLRSLVTEDLKQTPGKAMLDELVTRFRQQANAGIIPTNILAHMGTVQAWGNLSAHDHAGSLEDSGVRVGQQEVVASLNSMVAILSWYAEKKNLQPGSSARALQPVTSTSLTKPSTSSVTPALQPQSTSKTPLIAGVAAVVLALGGAGGWLATRAPAATAPPPASDPFAVLNGMYGAWDVPVPPEACRKADEAANLARDARNADQLALVSKPWPEAAYLRARALWDRERTQEQVSPEFQAALDTSMACPGFAAALHLGAQVAIKTKNLTVARTHVDAAIAAAPTWLEARVTRAGLLRELKDAEGAAKEVDGLLQARPDYAPAFLLRAFLKRDSGDDQAFADDLCKANSLGSQTAKDLARKTNVSCQ
jgi:hypothetical protein